MSLIVYFSSRSENTHRFVQRLGLPAVRIPLNESSDPKSQINEYLDAYKGEGIQHVAIIINQQN